MSTDTKMFFKNNLFIPDIAVALTYRCNLHCDYCYVKGLEKDIPDEISLFDFKKVICWLKKQNRNKIMLFGGEPTQHTKFIEILDLCYKQNLEFCLATNGLFSEEIALRLHRPNVAFVQVNYNHPSYYTPNQIVILDRVLSLLKKRRVSLYLRYNISQNMDNSNIFHVAKKYGAKAIMFGITFQGYSNNKFLSYENKSEVHDIFIDFLSKAEKNKINVRFAGPMPRCIFEETEWKNLEANTNLTSVCYPDTVGDFFSGLRIVNPDLSVFACFHIFIKAKNLFDFKTLEQLTRFFKKDINELKWKKHLYPECKDCDYFMNRKCQGSCLGAKTR